FLDDDRAGICIYPDFKPSAQCLSAAVTASMYRLGRKECRLWHGLMARCFGHRFARTVLRLPLWIGCFLYLAIRPVVSLTLGSRLPIAAWLVILPGLIIRACF